ncbi:MAG TPA: Uma2 family endonuclease [Urbifossiella sp.]|nr:Uma2 family endonuclease [Urbifossiella sp.]
MTTAVDDTRAISPPRSRLATVVSDQGRVTIPGWVTDLDAFRRWLDTADAPEKAKTWFLRGEVWVDMSKEQLFTHLLLKSEFYRVLGNLVKDGNLGWLYPDGLLLTNREADLSGNPDATFVSRPTAAAGRVVEIAGKEAGFVEIVGTPDMVLEVVSDSSVKKDTVILFTDYYAAGIPEYWLVDARGSEAAFTIHSRGDGGYLAVADEGGWQPSTVFGKSFRLTRAVSSRGNPEFTLEVR